MKAIELIRKHDPSNLGEFTNADYIEMFAYAKELEIELVQLRNHENLPISSVKKFPQNPTCGYCGDLKSTWHIGMREWTPCVGCHTENMI